MTSLTINATGALEIAPSKQSSHKDFDFLIGHWQIHNRKLKARLENCTEWIEFEATSLMQIILNGIGNTDHFYANLNARPFEGMTLRLFNPATSLWSIYWADSNNGTMDPPVLGSFDANIGTFYTKDVFNGIEIIVMFRWDKSDPEKPIWSQAFSEDMGATWEWNWYMYMSRP